MERRQPGHDGLNANRRAVLLAAAVGIGGACARAASAQTPATPAFGLAPVVQAWLDAYAARDHAAMAALYADDGVFEDVPNAFVARGDEIPAFLATMEQGLTDVTLDLRHAFGTADWAVIEYDFGATNGGMIPGTEPGGRFVSRAATVFELAGDKIRRSSDYYDTTSILVQLGVIPPMSPPAATPGA